MARRHFTSEDIIHKLREADVLLGQGKTIAEACKALGVTDHTYFRWRKQYGGLKVDQAKRLKELELENSRLKRVVAELSEPIETTHGTVTVGASVGVVVAQPGAEPVDRLLEAADRALYEVKAAGGGGWRLVERA